MLAVGVLALVRGGLAETAASAPAKTSRSDSEGADNGLLSSLSFTADRGPVTIDANQLEFDYRTRTLTYRGAVKVTQGDLMLRCDHLKVVLDEQAEQRLRNVVAEGAVSISQGNRLATGGRAVFDQATRTVVLEEKPVVREGPNEVAGEKVTVYLDERRSVVEGSVQAKLFPSGGATVTAPRGNGENDGR